MNRKDLLLSGMAFLMDAIPLYAQQTERPNIILLLADDVSATDFGCYGNDVVRTPNIDELAQFGLRFNNVYLSTSSSSPSRASLITGRYPHNTGACELHTDMGDEQVFFPSLLKEVGYYTAQSGKWHFSSTSSEDFSGPVRKAFDSVGGDTQHGGGPSGSEKWVETLRNRPKDKPFFMWFASHDAHRNWDNDIFLPRYSPDKVDVKPWYLDTPETRADIAAYYNEVSRFDYFVGEVVKELKRQSVFDNTLIIVMADNGRPFPRAKTRLLTDGIKTPFIISFPRLIAAGGQVCNSLISSIDIAPTIVDIAGGNQYPTFQGRSFKHLMGNPVDRFRTYAFAEHNWHDYEAYERAVYTDTHMLIVNGRTNLNAEGAIDIMNGGTGVSLLNNRHRLNDLQADIFRVNRDSVELYDLTNDRYQYVQLPNDSPYQGKLLSVLREWQEDTRDTCPDHLTEDWYDRETRQPTTQKSVRGEMPGTSRQATLINKSGPF